MKTQLNCSVIKQLIHSIDVAVFVIERWYLGECDDYSHHFGRRIGYPIMATVPEIVSQAIHALGGKQHIASKYPFAGIIFGGDWSADYSL